MIDLHSHLLPGVDDGARTPERAVEVLEGFAAGGVREVCLTPHLEASRVEVGPPPAHDEAFAALSRLAPAEIRLHRGAEVMLDRAVAPGAVAARRITLAGSRAILVEFTPFVTAAAATRALAAVVEAGLVPLLAHPERYGAAAPPVVRRWREGGALMQVDATTIFQPTGRGRRARSLLAEGLADVLASDNHGDERSLATVFERLAAGGAEKTAALLLETNPGLILADQPVEPVPPLEIALPLGGRLRTWLDGWRR